VTDPFTESWDEFLRAMRRARGRVNAAPSVSGLSLSQFQVVEPLETASRGVGELAAAAGVAAPTATRMLAALERQGVVTRTAGDGDRRRVVVELTAAGREMVTRKRAEVVALRGRLRESLEPGEREQAAALLRKLAGLMETL
jgi:DNA-binding MarR family transcriptional regulator